MARLLEYEIYRGMLCVDSDDLRFFDAHLHLQDEKIQHSVPQLLEEAQAVGVERFACNGCCEDDWSKVEQLAEEHPQIIPNFGLHPWWVTKQTQNWLSDLRKFLERNPTAGLGECGLDRCKRAAHIDFEQQSSIFQQQIRLAKELKRPVSVHCVQAFGHLEEILREEAPLPDGVILHSWGGSGAQVKSLAKLEGVHFSISGHSITGSSKKIRSMLKQIPLERLLLETDAPDGTPALEGLLTVAQQSGQDEADDLKLNHPGNIRLILGFMAKETGLDQAVLARHAFQNACRLFLRG